MLLEIVSGAMPLLETGTGGVTRHAGMTGKGSPRASDLGYEDVLRLLYNWQRWSADWFPELGVQAPPWAEQWLPNLAWDSGWGDPIPLDAPPPEIDEAAAALVDKKIMVLAAEHRETLKRHFIGVRTNGQRKIQRQPREVVDAAIRALGDIL